MSNIKKKTQTKKNLKKALLGLMLSFGASQHTYAGKTPTNPFKLSLFSPKSQAPHHSKLADFKKEVRGPSFNTTHSRNPEVDDYQLLLDKPDAYLDDELDESYAISAWDGPLSKKASSNPMQFLNANGSIAPHKANGAYSSAIPLEQEEDYENELNHYLDTLPEEDTQEIVFPSLTEKSPASAVTSAKNAIQKKHSLRKSISGKRVAVKKITKKVAVKKKLQRAKLARTFNHSAVKNKARKSVKVAQDTAKTLRKQHNTARTVRKLSEPSKLSKP